MTTPPAVPQCRSCRREPANDGILGPSCTDQLETILAELPSRLRDLQTTVTRQARVGNPPARGSGLGELIAADADHARVPAALRSRQGRIALASTPLMFHEHAAQLAAQAAEAVRQWCDLVSGARGLPRPAQGVVTAPARYVAVIRRNRALSITEVTPAKVRVTPVTTQDLCVWLVAHIDQVRQVEASVKMHRRFSQLARRIDAAVDRHDPDVFAGRCTAQTVSVRVVDMVDVSSGPWAQYVPAVLEPHVDDCGAELYAHDGAPTATCPACHAVYDMTTQRRILAASVAEVWARPHTIANALTELDEPIRPDTLRKWIERDQRAVAQWRAGERPEPDWPLVTARMLDDDRHPVYRVGDVQARIAWQRDRADRAKVSA